MNKKLYEVRLRSGSCPVDETYIKLIGLTIQEINLLSSIFFKGEPERTNTIEFWPCYDNDGEDE